MENDLTGILEEELCQHPSQKNVCYYGMHELVHCAYHKELGHKCLYRPGNPLPIVILKRYSDDVYGDVPQLPNLLKEPTE